MYPAKVSYHRAGSVAEAVQLLADNEDSKILAGGHSLIPLMKLRLAGPAALIDIGRIDGLRGIARENGTVRIGALTTHAELASSSDLEAACPLVSEAAEMIGDPMVRNRATIGGNLAHADPASGPADGGHGAGRLDQRDRARRRPEHRRRGLLPGPDDDRSRRR